MILVRLVQRLNAELPMDVMLLGSVILIKLLQSSNALSAIIVPPVITTVFSEFGTIPKT